jgi:hypothetical protein
MEANMTEVTPIPLAFAAAEISSINFNHLYSLKLSSAYQPPYAKYSALTY